MGTRAPRCGDRCLPGATDRSKPVPGCGSGMQAIQYVSPAWTGLDGSFHPARQSVCLVCPVCDSAAVVASKP